MDRSRLLLLLPLPLLLAAGRAPAPIALTIDGDAATSLLPPLPTLLSGYRKAQLADTGLPRVGSEPSFTHELGVHPLPLHVPSAVPADGLTHLVAWVDVNGSGTLDTGDRCSRPGAPLLVLPGMEAGPPPPVTLTIERTWVASGAPSTDEPSVRLAVELTAADGLVDRRRGSVLLLGFAPAELEGGLPRRGSRPTFEWSRRFSPLAWPLRFEVTPPPGLLLLPVLDEGGDGRLSPGDPLGPAALPGDEGQLPLRLDRRLAGAPQNRGCG